jgi:hypothetical protein
MSLRHGVSWTINSESRKPKQVRHKLYHGLLGLLLALAANGHSSSCTEALRRKALRAQGPVQSSHIAPHTWRTHKHAASLQYSHWMV